jgi:hypothetical protein
MGMKKPPHPDWMGGGETVATSVALPTHSASELAGRDPRGPRGLPPTSGGAGQNAELGETVVQSRLAVRHLPSHDIGRLPRHLDSSLRLFPADKQ